MAKGMGKAGSAATDFVTNSWGASWILPILTNRVGVLHHTKVSPEPLARCMESIDPNAESLSPHEMASKVQSLTNEIEYIVTHLRELHRRDVKFKSAETAQDECLRAANLFEQAAALLQSWWPDNVPRLPRDREFEDIFSVPIGPYLDIFAYERKG
jgi:hypothetical protein